MSTTSEEHEKAESEQPADLSVQKTNEGELNATKASVKKPGTKKAGTKKTGAKKASEKKSGVKKESTQKSQRTHDSWHVNWVKAGNHSRQHIRQQRLVRGKKIHEKIALRQALRHPVDYVGDELRADHYHHLAPVRLMGWSVLIGLVVGVIVSLFRRAISHLLLGVQWMYAQARMGQWWWLGVIAAVCLVISFVVAWMVLTQPASSGSGIPDVEKRLRASQPIFFHWWSILWRKIVGGLLCFAPGMMLGREGPSVQIGACVGMGFGPLSRTTRKTRKELVAAGAAAGLSAAFTAPIAGVLFVMEEVYSRFTIKTGLCAFTSSIVASAVTVQVFGLHPVFALPDTYKLPLWQYWQLLVLALVVGLIAKLYEKSLFWATNFYSWARIPMAFRPFIPMLLLLPVGVYFPFLLGGGNGLVDALGKNRYSIGLLVAFLVIRLVVSQLSYGSGVPGGIFLPMLALGSLVGALVAEIFIALGLGYNTMGYISLMVIVGMAGLFGSVTRAPLTAIILVMEMTSDAELLPLGVVTLLAYLIYDLFGGEPIYDELGAHPAKKVFSLLRVSQLGTLNGQARKAENGEFGRTAENIERA